MPLGAHKAAIMGVAGVSTGDVVLLSSQTATSDTVITFDSDITSTYGEYIFRFYNMNPETDNAEFGFQANVVGASGYNETMTTSFFQNYQDEGGTVHTLHYVTANDQAEGTSYDTLAGNVGSDADQSCSGVLHVFNPSSTTYVTHFIGHLQTSDGANNCVDQFPAGYFNATGAIDDIQFKFSAGDFDGKIKMWGVK